MSERGKVLRPKIITRAMVQADRATIFVFGDNMAHRGLGGQAKEMRGESNTIGVPTKWAPGRAAREYFRNDDFFNRLVIEALEKAFDAINFYLATSHNVAIPADGLGTGLAKLPTRAPKIHAWIEAQIAGLEGADAQ